VERASYLPLRIRQHESAVLRGAEPRIDSGTYSNHVNVLVRVLKPLGLDRRARNVRSFGESWEAPRERVLASTRCRAVHGW